MIKTRIQKRIAAVLLTAQALNILCPTGAYALMSGPSQPEVQSFEPVATTQTVDPFTGDFTYNIPLLEVDGYPINISYHSGYGMEDEASWVGLGWNLNPGCVNRAVRGLPDDFKGDRIRKSTFIEPERTTSVSGGLQTNPELFGFEIPVRLSATMGLTYNNYRGVSASVDGGGTVGPPMASATVGFGVNSQGGADIDASLKFATTSNLKAQSSGNASFNVGSGFNTRTGLKNVTYGLSYDSKMAVSSSGRNAGSTTITASCVPIGLQNYVAVNTNVSTTRAYSLHIKYGPAFMGAFGSLIGRAYHAINETQVDGSRNSYGYLYSEFAKNTDILDFSREKDGIYNTTLSFLPTSTSTYDLYSVSGQGTGGVFRPFRNDIGTVYDPLVSPDPPSKA